MPDDASRDVDQQGPPAQWSASRIRHSAEQQREIRGEVRRLMLQGRWNGEKMESLAAEHGLSTRQIRNYRREILLEMEDDWRDRECGVSGRSEYVARMQTLQGAAIKAGEWPAVVKLAQAEAVARGFTLPPSTAETSDDVPCDSPPRSRERADPLQAHLQIVRRMRQDAQGAGSWVAAANLARQEADAIAAIDRRDREREERERLSTDWRAAIAEVITVIDTLPETMVAELAAAIERRRARTL